jgi:uncharacterized protein (DUF169 family)
MKSITGSCREPSTNILRKISSLLKNKGFMRLTLFCMNITREQEKKRRKKMTDWKETGETLKSMLRLRTEPIAYKKFEDAVALDGLGNVFRFNHAYTFCQAIFAARVMGQTVGVVKDNKLIARCSQFHGLHNATEDEITAESKMLSKTWLGTPEEAAVQLKECPRIPAGEAVAMSPLARGVLEPDVVLVYGNPAQIMFIMNGLQKEKHKRFQFYFVGEGSCSDHLAQCFVSGEPAFTVPCYGERSLGQVADDEVVIALPPSAVETAVSGMKKLAKFGFRYPVTPIGGLADPIPMFASVYG